MCKIQQVIFCLFLLLIGQRVLSQTTLRTQSDYYKIGLTQRDAGDWVAAIKSWVTGGQVLQRQQKADPRIGISFIELITEQKAKRYFDLACEMYLWGFSQGGLQTYSNEIEKEVKRIAPLLSKEMRKKWFSLLKKNDPKLLVEIKSFWLKKDPTPTTSVNERLLEHWERIAYSRKHFKNNKSAVYGTDDRGLIYVKYGKPERIVKGSLGTRQAHFKQWTDFMIEGEETITGDASGVSSGVSSPSRRRAEEQGFLIREIDRFNNYPEYEIWFYHSFDTDEPISYMFGNREGIGRYGLRDGVEDFIPSRAFLRTSSNRTGGISPGAILQSVYYSELMHLSPDFEDRFNELERIWNRMGSNKSTMVANSLFRVKRQTFKTEDKINTVSSSIPSEKSSVDQIIPKVRVLVSPFRFLNKQSLPKIALVTLSYPQITMDYIRASGDQFPDYSLTQTEIAYDRNHDEIQRQSKALDSRGDNIYTFILSHKEEQSDYDIVSEVFYSPLSDIADTTGEEHQHPEIMALGRSSVAGLPPLSPAKESLELSDLLVGVNNPGADESKRMPFPLVPSTRILAVDLLKIYFEIYHLYFDESGTVHYTIDFEVARLKGAKKVKEASISLSFNFDAYERTSKEQFEVDISKLSFGRYELRVQVTDNVSMQKKIRTADFEIIE